MKLQQFALAIHGGAGNLTVLNDDLDYAEHRDILQSTLDQGIKELEKGMPAIETAHLLVALLENCPLFNAGKGSVFNRDGQIEMDASIMEGKNKKVGAVSGVKTIKNPITLAKSILENSPHVLLSGVGAEEFARDHNLNLETVPEYFFTEKRWDDFLIAKNNKQVQLDHTENKYGTVGAVVLDCQGNMAAATSTGGLTNKYPGRVSDSAIIGHGTWADNLTAAISCTGQGDVFSTLSTAKNVADLIKMKKLNLRTACEQSLNEVKEYGGLGGIIALNNNGEIYCGMNTKMMFRAYYASTKEKVVAIH